MTVAPATCPYHRLDEFNPFDPNLAPWLDKLVADLRAAPPAFFLDQLGMWVITDPELAQRVARDSRTQVRFRDQLVAARGEQALVEPFNQAWDKVVLNLDGDDHRRVRRCFTRHFNPRRVESLRPGMIALADRLLAELATEGHADLIQRFLLPLVHRTISLLIGVPAEDAGELLRWTHAIHQNEQASVRVDDAGVTNSRAAHAALTRYFTGLIAQRRNAPTDDLLSAMITECDAGNLSDGELVANTWALYLGGFDTTASVAAMALVALQDQPEQRDILAAQSPVSAAAIEELMRVGLVALGSTRFLGEDLRVADVTIPAGARVYLSWATSNFDEQRWPEPMRLDLTREPGAHMTFAFGPHTCLGQWLARAAVEVAVQAVYRNLPDIRVGPLQWAPNPAARIVGSLPATWPPPGHTVGDHSSPAGERG